MEEMHKEQSGGIIIYRWKIFEPWRHSLSAVLTTKHGGSIRQHDRDMISDILGFPDAPWAMCEQVHGTRIVSLSSDEKPPYRACDAVVIDRPGYVSGVFLADCHPIMIYDPIRHIAGVAHAGWRGTLAGIPMLLVEQMKTGGSRPDNLIAAVGPGIGPCCYTVGDDVAHQFLGRFIDGDTFLTRDKENGLWRLDIEEVNFRSLRKIGIPSKQISRGGFCTACTSDDFYSHRRDKGVTGRQTAIMIIHPKSA